MTPSLILARLGARVLASLRRACSRRSHNRVFTPRRRRLLGGAALCLLLMACMQLGAIQDTWRMRDMPARSPADWQAIEARFVAVCDQAGLVRTRSAHHTDSRLVWIVYELPVTSDDQPSRSAAGAQILQKAQVRLHLSPGACSISIIAMAPDQERLAGVRSALEVLIKEFSGAVEFRHHVVSLSDWRVA